MTGTAVRAPGLMLHPSFSPAIVTTGATTVYVAGQLPLTAEGALIGADDIEAQVERVWVQIEGILDAAGAVLADVVKVTAYTTDARYIDAIVSARQRRFEGLTPPASALVVVQGLAIAGAVVEIEAVAVW